MKSPALDDVDRGILHMLQEDARNHSASGIADAVGVAPNTVRNRIARMEDAGVIEGYHPHINYERAGYQLRVQFICTVPISKREAMAEQALEIVGVVGVTEVVSGHENLVIEAVGTETSDVTSIATQIEDRDIRIHDERFLRAVRVQPFNHFGGDVLSDA